MNIYTGILNNVDASILSDTTLNEDVMRIEINVEHSSTKNKIFSWRVSIRLELTKCVDEHVTEGFKEGKIHTVFADFAHAVGSSTCYGLRLCAV